MTLEKGAEHKMFPAAIEWSDIPVRNAPFASETGHFKIFHDLTAGFLSHESAALKAVEY